MIPFAYSEAVVRFSATFLDLNLVQSRKFGEDFPELRSIIDMHAMGNSCVYTRPAHYYGLPDGFNTNFWKEKGSGKTCSAINNMENRTSLDVHYVNIRLGVESQVLLTHNHAKAPRRVTNALAWFTECYYLFQ